MIDFENPLAAVKELKDLTQEAGLPVPLTRFGKIPQHVLVSAALYGAPDSGCSELDARDYAAAREAMKELLPRDVDNLILEAREFQAKAEYAQARAREFAGRAARYKVNAETLLGILEEALAARGPEARAEGVVFEASLAISQRVVAPEDREELEALAEINPELVRAKLSPVKAAIKKALRAGEALPGCRLENVRHVRIGEAPGCQGAAESSRADNQEEE